MYAEWRTRRSSSEGRARPAHHDTEAKGCIDPLGSATCMPRFEKCHVLSDENQFIPVEREI